MRINTPDFKKKCLSPKYYSAIKCMSHALKDRERYFFIKNVCNINIYLGCLCATTCEYNQKIEIYIENRIMSFFRLKKARYYDNGEGKQIIYPPSSFTVTNYLLACNLMGMDNQIHKYIRENAVEKNTLIALASEMNEDRLLDLMLTVVNSELNRDKIRGLGSTKNLYIKRNDNRTKKLLHILFKIDKDAYIQFAYDVGVLGDIWENNNNGKAIYVHLLNKCSKVKLAINYFTEVLGEEELVSILEKSSIGRDFLYLVFLEKVQRGATLSENEYSIAESLPSPPEKISNYFIPFFMNFRKASEFYENINYIRFYECFGELYTNKIKKRSIKVGITSNKLITHIVKNASIDNWEKIVELYFGTCLSEGVSLDDLFRQLNEYFEIQLSDFLDRIKKYSLEVEEGARGLKFRFIRTEKYLFIVDNKEIEKDSFYYICDYDYISHHIFVDVVC